MVGRKVKETNWMSGLDDVVDDIIITDELGGVQFRKPCDIAFRILQNRWRLPFEQIVYVGDNPNKDFMGPKQLGMKFLWFKNTDGLYQSSQIEAEVGCSKSIEEIKNQLLKRGYNSYGKHR